MTGGAGPGRSRRAPDRHRCLATCPLGLEPWCAAELVDLGAVVRRTLAGGVEFGATTRQLYLANRWLRTATRVLVRMGSFTVRRLEDLEPAVAALGWAPYVAPGQVPVVRVSTTASALWHTGAVAERAVAGVATATGEAVADLDPTALDPAPGQHDPSSPTFPAPSDRAASSVEGNDAVLPSGPLVVVRVVHDRVMVSIDSSGAPLHQRGWRHSSGKAPLRETLAAGMVLASGWDRVAPLADPMCGAGTVAIEAAMIAAGLPPGGHRDFAFRRWPAFQPGTWASALAAPSPHPPTSPPPRIFASDRDAGAVAGAKANAARAGVEIDVARAAVSDSGSAVGSAAGWLLSNPPYGKRLTDGGDLRDLYAQLGKVLRTRFVGWHAGLLVADRHMAAATGLVLTQRWASRNGGIPVTFLASR